MLNKMLSRIIAVLMLGTMCLFATEKQIEKIFKVGSGGTLIIDASMGSIQVETQDANEVKAVVTFESKTGTRQLEEYMEEIHLNFNQVGDNVEIVLDKKNGDSFFRDFWNHFRVKFNVTVPLQYHVDLKTSGGSIAVSDLEGNAKTRTSGGSLKFGKIKGRVDGRTSGGSIQLEGCEGPADVHTSGGSIKIGAVKGNVEAHTSGGSISVDEVMGSINANTSGGSINARISKQPENDCELRTSGGSVSVYLASDIKVNVDAKTSGGNVYTDFPVTVQGNISKKSLNAEINGGGPLLLLRTSGGGINIKEM